jgi:hypothetical protein
MGALGQFLVDRQRLGHDEAIRGGREPLYSSRGVDLFVDPVTIETILEVGGFVLSLFKKDDSEEQLEWLRKISAEEDQLKQLLDEVLSILRGMNVLLRAEFAADAEVKLLSVVDTCIDGLPEWKANANKYQEAAIDRLTAIQDGANTNMRYGYACFNTVGMTLRFESELLDLTKSTPGARLRRYDRYIGYFRSSLDANQPGSLSQGRAAEEQAAAKLTTGQFGHPPVSTSYRCGICTCTAVVDGSLVQGFHGWVGKSNCDHYNPMHGHGGGPLLVRLVTRDANAVVYAPPDEQLDALLNAANAAATDYQAHAANAAALRAAEQQAEGYLQVATKLRNDASKG